MHRVNRLISTFFGVGYSPIAPGTIAAAVAAVIWYFISRYNNVHPLLPVVLIVIASVAGIYCSGKIASHDNTDPSFVVIDEVAGMWLSLFLIPPSPINILIAFILFRFFDIVKPLGIKSMEQRKNGWGIMLDDLLAGFYSNFALQILLVFKLW